MRELVRTLRSGAFHPVLGVGWALLLTGSAAWGWLNRDGFVGDQAYFSRLGGDVLSGRWGGVYTDPQLQAGPWQLVLVHLLQLGRTPGLETGSAGPAVALLLPLFALATGLGVRGLRRAAGVGPARGLELLVAFAAVTWGPGSTLGWSGHLSE